MNYQDKFLQYMRDKGMNVIPAEAENCRYRFFALPGSIILWRSFMASSAKVIRHRADNGIPYAQVLCEANLALELQLGMGLPVLSRYPPRLITII